MSEYRFESARPACSTSYVLPLLRSLLANQPRQSVIADLGCGNGSLLAQFLDRKWELHGLEISESGLAQARSAYPGIQFHSVDLTQDLSAHVLAGSCDVVISTEVIEHVFQPRIFARNCHHLLKPNATLIISTPYHGYLKNLALAISGKLDSHFTALWDYGHIKFWSKATLTELLQETGFTVKEFRGAGRIPFLWKSMVLVATKPGV